MREPVIAMSAELERARNRTEVTLSIAVAAIAPTTAHPVSTPGPLLAARDRHQGPASERPQEPLQEPQEPRHSSGPGLGADPGPGLARRLLQPVFEDGPTRSRSQRMSLFRARSRPTARTRFLSRPVALVQDARRARVLPDRPGEAGDVGATDSVDMVNSVADAREEDARLADGR